MRMLARLIVALRFLIVPAWIAGAIWVSLGTPSIFSSETSELGSLLPRNSSAIEVEERGIEVFGLPVLSRTMVVAHEADGFSTKQGEAAARFIGEVDEAQGAAAHLRAVPLLDAPGLLESKQLGSTLVAYLYVDPSLRESEQADAVDRFAAQLQERTGAETVHVTGAVPASRAETNIADDDLLWVELATVILVVSILALYFRSIGIPALGLVTVAIAYQVTDHLLGWASERYSISIPREVDPVIIALLFGILTDYLVFFVSDYRRHLQEGLNSCEAVRKVTTELLPVILTAALMIAGATLTLLLSGVRFLSAFGPGMAVAVLVGAAVALTFIPATLAIFGRILLWPSCPNPETAGTHPREQGPRGRLVGFAAQHPAIVAITCLALLLAAASGLRKLELGNPIISGLPTSTEARQGYEVAKTTLGPGVVGPTMLMLEEPGIGGHRQQLAALQLALGERDGVAEVVGPAMEPAGRPYGVLVSKNGDAARFVLVLSADPDGAEGTRILSNLESDMPEMVEEAGLAPSQVGMTGDTNIAAELNSDTWNAFERVTPAALLVLLVLLWVLLRSRTAPLYLVGVSVLVVAAALGLTVYVFQDLLGYGELAFFVPIATAILLLALGADYNVFLVSPSGARPSGRTCGRRSAPRGRGRRARSPSRG